MALGQPLVFAIARQERRSELRRGALVLTAAFTLAPWATVAARSAVASAATALTTRAAIAVTPSAATMPVAARTAVAAFPRLARRAGVGQLFAGLLVDEAHRQANLAALVDFEQL